MNNSTIKATTGNNYCFSIRMVFIVLTGYVGTHCNKEKRIPIIAVIIANTFLKRKLYLKFFSTWKNLKFI